jgi:hypothetical protein
MVGDVMLEVSQPHLTTRIENTSLICCTSFVVEILCGKAVADLQKEVKTLAGDKRINGFAINQLCIAEKSCKNKRKLDNPSWIDNVVNTFVEPYIRRDGEWNSIIEECRKFEDPWYNLYYKMLEPAEYRCQELMAGYHIPVDLQYAVNKHGCGTKKDWDLIGEYIKDCVEAADMHILAEWYARWEVYKQRNVVRTNCIQQRKSLGLQMEF